MEKTTAEDTKQAIEINDAILDMDVNGAEVVTF